MKLVLISDTHGLLSRIAVPDGDVLIHAGDLTMQGTFLQVTEELAVLAALPHHTKIFIAGNHDFAFQTDHRFGWREYAAQRNMCYLQDRAIEIHGLKFYGSPWQPWFHNWAFNLTRGLKLREKWMAIPADTDVLITHGPPTGYGSQNEAGDEVGDDDLLDEVVHRVKPQLHVSGHIHEGYGERHHPLLPIRIVNASSVDLDYHPTNPPIVIEL